MQAVEELAGSQLVATEFDAGGANATAYAARSPKGWRIALVNKDAHTDISVQLRAPAGAPRPVRTSRLTGPSLDAIDGISLQTRTVGAMRGNLVFDLPRASALVISLE
jgi:hypothetical protein